MPKPKRDTLWAPWRLEYVVNKKQSSKKECPFCTEPKKKNSYNTLVVYKDKDLAIMMNKFPYNPFHLLVVPRGHYADPGDLSEKQSLKLYKCVHEAYLVLKKALKMNGANIGINLGSAGGAGIPTHLHWHIIPRWNSDTNFMPVIGEVKSVPAHNKKVYEELEILFEDFADKLREV